MHRMEFGYRNTERWGEKKKYSELAYMGNV